jgi:2-polyprenyl-3-methyl-5-hydroxy-6-metoxy-1,4-benzoquinol methylase
MAKPLSQMSRFDAEFYRRFYLDPRTRVTSAAEMNRRAQTIAALVRHLDIPVKRILDAGCGLGLMRKPLLRALPGSTYLGVEVSEHLCERYGWKHGSLPDFTAPGQFDLIVCYDVLQYLNDRDAAGAIANLARLSRGAFYFHAPTLEDWRRNADRSCSDGEIHLRAAGWYRTRLARHFRYAGLGLHVRRGISFVQWELEKPDALT